MSKTIAAYAALGVLAASPTLHAASGNEYPNRPIRIILPFAPGGGADIVARVIAQKLGERLGQTAVVDNRPGGGATIGTEMGARAAPDGYTLLIASKTSLAVNPVIMKVGYDPVKDFTPITLLGTQPHMLVVNPSLPVRNVQEFIALAKAKPGALNYSSSGTGGPTHLGCELLRMATGISIVHVPYKGQSPGLLGLIGGEVQFSMPSVASVVPHVKGGKLRALSVTSAKRLPVAPELPTMIESGYAGFDVNSWTALFGPAALPRAIADRLYREVVELLKQPEVVAKLAGDGVDPGGNSPEELASYVRQEIVMWAKVVKAAGIKAE
jgi:tripartite-type tricarboxylate transporter receptor subunit TctC